MLNEGINSYFIMPLANGLSMTLSWWRRRVGFDRSFWREYAQLHMVIFLSLLLNCDFFVSRLLVPRGQSYRFCLLVRMLARIDICWQWEICREVVGDLSACGYFHKELGYADTSSRCAGRLYSVHQISFDLNISDATCTLYNR